MKHFQDAVRRRMQKEGWHVFVICDTDEPVDLVCINESKVRLIRARGNGHGHIQDKVEQELKALGKQCGEHVLLAKANSENEITFHRVYPKY